MNDLYKAPLFILCALLVAACQADTISARQAPAVAQPLPVPKNIKRGAGKPSMNIELKQYEYLIPVEETTRLDTALLSGLAEGELTVEASAGPGLIILEGSFKHFASVAEPELPLTLSVYAEQAGKHYLSLSLTHSASRPAFPTKQLKLILWAGGKTEAGLEKNSDSVKKVVLPAKESLN